MPGWAGLGTHATSWLVPSLSTGSGQEGWWEWKGNDRGGASLRSVALLFLATRARANCTLELWSLRVGKPLPGWELWQGWDPEGGICFLSLAKHSSQLSDASRQG